MLINWMGFPIQRHPVDPESPLNPMAKELEVPPAMVWVRAEGRRVPITHMQPVGGTA